jgi:hypothetical protein
MVGSVGRVDVEQARLPAIMWVSKVAASRSTCATAPGSLSSTSLRQSLPTRSRIKSSRAALTPRSCRMRRSRWLAARNSGPSEVCSGGGSDTTRLCTHSGAAAASCSPMAPL